MKQVVRFNVKPTDYLNKVLDKFTKLKLGGLYTGIVMVGSYIHITNGYLIIKMPSECVYADGNLGALTYRNDTKSIDFREVDNYTELKGYRLLENIQLTQEHTETTTIGYDSFPNLLSAAKYIGKKTKYQSKTYILLENETEKGICLEHLTKCKKFINSFGFDLNKVCSIKNYQHFITLSIGDITIAISKADISKVVGNALIIGEDSVQECSEMISELGGYENFLKCATKYVSKTEEGVCIRNTKYLNKEVYYGNRVIDLIDKLQQINEQVLPYIKVGSGIKDEIQTLLIELRDVELSEKISFK